MKGQRVDGRDEDVIVVAQDTPQDFTLCRDANDTPETPRQPNPLPAKQMLIILLATFVEPVQFGILFPFVYFMVRDFGVATSEDHLGFYVGFLASSFSLAQFLSAVPWGRASDQWGRRPILLIGLVGNAITCAAFGASKSFWVALVLRSLNGLLNGNTGVCKSILGEISDSTNRALAFSLWEASSGLGSIVGPAIGGFLVNPAERFPSIFGHDQIWRDSPYLLPCLASALISLFGALMGFLFMEETLGKGKPDKITAAGEEEALLIDSSSHSPLIQSVSAKTLLEEDENQIISIEPASKTGIPALPDQGSPTLAGVLTPSVIHSIFAYALWAFLNVIYDEVFALFVSTPLKYGGLSFTSFDLGNILTVAGVVHIIFQLGVFPIMDRSWGLIKCYRFGALLMVLFSLLLPFIGDLAQYFMSLEANPATLSTSQRSIIFWLVTLAFAGRTVGTLIGYTSVMILVNDSAPHPRSLGSVHGVGQLCAALVRTLGPAVTGIAWSWSISNGWHIPLLDFHFVPIIIVLLSALAYFESFHLIHGPGVIQLPSTPDI